MPITCRTDCRDRHECLCKVMAPESGVTWKTVPGKTVPGITDALTPRYPRSFLGETTDWCAGQPESGVTSWKRRKQRYGWFGGEDRQSTEYLSCP